MSNKILVVKNYVTATHLIFRCITKGLGRVQWNRQHSNTGWMVATEQDSHINILELKACQLTLFTFCKDVKQTHVRVYMDNTTSCSYINKFGENNRVGLYRQSYLDLAYRKTYSPQCCSYPREGQLRSRWRITQRKWWYRVVNIKGLCSAMNKIFKVYLKINYLLTEPNLKSVGRVIASKFYF